MGSSRILVMISKKNLRQGKIEMEIHPYIRLNHL